jgi:hypothetical protein
MSRIKGLKSRGIFLESRAKTLNGIREMRIYFGSVATRSEVRRNVGRISADDRPKRCDGPDRSDQECSTFWNGFYPSKLWVIRRVEIESGRLMNAVRSICSVCCTMLPAPL